MDFAYDAQTQQRIETLIVGAGQAGLATGYHLNRKGREFLVVDGNDRVGDNWRRHYDSLRLYTPAQYCGLPGMAFPAEKHSFPGKDEVADYLETYALRFDLPVRLRTRIDRLTACTIRVSTGMYPRHFRECGGQNPKSPLNSASTSGSLHGHHVSIDPAYRVTSASVNRSSASGNSGSPAACFSHSGVPKCMTSRYSSSPISFAAPIRSSAILQSK